MYKISRKTKTRYSSIAVVLILFILTSPYAHCQVALLKSVPKNQRYIALFQIISFQNPAEKNKLLLDSIVQFAKAENDPFLSCEAHVIWAKYAARPAQSANQKLVFFNEIWQQIKDYDNDEIKSFYYHELGFAYLDAQDFEHAFHYIIKATDIFERIGYNKLQLGALYSCDLFRFYYRFEDYQLAAKYSKLSVALNDTFPATHVSRLNDLGCTYLKMKDYNNAAATFKKVMEVAVGLETAYVGIGSANYGNTLRLQGKFLEALPYLYEEFKLSEKAAPEDCAITCLYISDCLLHLDSVAKAKKYLDLAPTFSPNYINSDYNLHYLEVAAKYYQTTKQFEAASKYLQQLLRVKDSLKNLFSTQLLMATTLRAKEEKLLIEQQKAGQKATNIRLVRNVVIALLSAVFLVVLYIINEKRKNERRRQQVLQQQSAQRLRLAHEKLNQHLNSIKEKNAFIEKIEQQLAAMQPALVDEESTQLALEQLHQSVILTDDDWATFKQLCEQVWPGMFKQLNEQFPDLNRSEERLLALSKLNISSKEMAGMIGISVDSLRKSRYRLRKKYPALTDDENFRNLL